MYHFLFFLIQPFVFWVKFDTVESINEIPEDRQNLLDFCPICMKELGSKSTRVHKLHDLTVHPRSDKEKVQELSRGGTGIYLMVIFAFFILTAVTGVLTESIKFAMAFFDTDEYDETIKLSNQTKEFVLTCLVLERYYNDKIGNETLTPQLYAEIYEGVGTCFERFYISVPVDGELVERFHNITNKTARYGW